MTSREKLDAIFRAALQRVNPYQMIRDNLELKENLLVISSATEKLELNLSAFSDIVVLGTGKATAPMARGIEKLLGPRITDGLIVVKYGHTEELQHIKTIEAAHPVPDENSVLGAKRLVEIAQKMGEETLVINLVSGGGSALLALPGQGPAAHQNIQLTLQDKQDITATLLGCGADICEINCVRKHLSGIKGGRFLKHLYPARSVNLILSDVVGDDLSSIASGLTAADATSFEDSLSILQKYDITEKIPQSVLRYLQLGAVGEIPETLKGNDSAVGKTTNILLGTNRSALVGGAQKAEELGYNVVQLTSRITGEAREVAKVLGGIAVEQKRYGQLSQLPTCIISGGEPVVTLKGEGKGGRNQEMALAFLAQMEQNPEWYEGISFLSGATDGNDGPTDSAGGFADNELLAESKIQQLDITEYLQNNDSYTFLSKVAGHCITGPTNTNVCDLQIILVE